MGYKYTELNAQVDEMATQALTPELKEELNSYLTSPDVDQFLQEGMMRFQEGEVVKGQVVSIMDDRVLVDIGYKSEGVVRITDFPDRSELKEGVTFDFYIEVPENEEGMPVLSKTKADRIKNWEYVQKIFEENGTIEGTVIRKVKGGLKVDIGVDAFMPGSQVSTRPINDLDEFVGKRMELRILSLNQKRRNVVVSHRKLLEERREEERKRLIETIKVGAIVQGEVKNITDFGAFIDLGGLDGLLHVSDMTWGRPKNPHQMLKIGQKIDVMVLTYDPETHRVSLGLKQKTPNPWLNAMEKYPVGSIVTGTVISLADYGAFVQMEDGLEGMIHISEMSWTRRVRHPSEIMNIGDEVHVMVLHVDPDEQKISLGLKQTQPNPWKMMAEKYPVGSVVKGRVRAIMDYGAFIEIEEGIDGLLHVGDISWTKKVTNPAEVLKKDQEIEVKILSIDPEMEKISVGLKQLEPDPWQELIESMPIGKHVEVEVSKLVSFGAFAKLENGIEGLIHLSEMSMEKVQRPEDFLHVGQKVMAKIISISPVERKVGLSIREYQKDLEGEIMQTHSEAGEPVDVGSMLKDVIPAELLQQGKSIEEVADKLIHNGGSNITTSTEESSQDTTQGTPTEEMPETAPEITAKEEDPEVGVGEAPSSAAPEEEPPPTE